MERIYTVVNLDSPDWERVEQVTLTHTPWLEPCPIEAAAQVCRCGEMLWVRMTARERAVRATLTGPLDPVCEDSCLEFFFAPKEGDGRYFNFEFNPLGTLYLGYGAQRQTRVRQIPRSVEQMFAPEITVGEEGWELVYRIPLSFVQMYFPECSFTGDWSCNFYKCGDRTEVPHYLAWAPLSSPTPDFHRRQDFGILRFAP